LRTPGFLPYAPQHPTAKKQAATDEHLKASTRLRILGTSRLRKTDGTHSKKIRIDTSKEGPASSQTWKTQASTTPKAQLFPFPEKAKWQAGSSNAWQTTNSDSFIPQ
jgi:hypothetical protein